jgi:hypothetical protein
MTTTTEGFIVSNAHAASLAASLWSCVTGSHLEPTKRSCFLTLACNKEEACLFLDKLVLLPVSLLQLATGFFLQLNNDISNCHLKHCLSGLQVLVHHCAEISESFLTSAVLPLDAGMARCMVIL